MVKNNVTLIENVLDEPIRNFNTSYGVVNYRKIGEVNMINAIHNNDFIDCCIIWWKLQKSILGTYKTVTINNLFIENNQNVKHFEIYLPFDIDNNKIPLTWSFDKYLKILNNIMI